MKDLRVTKDFLKKESAYRVYDDFWQSIFLLPFLTLLGVGIGAVVGTMLGALIGWIFGDLGHFLHACAACLSPVGGVAAIIFMVRQPKFLRRRKVRSSIFGSTLDRLYSLNQKIGLHYGLSSGEIKAQKERVQNMMDEVWQEAHKLLGLVLDETPCLKSAEELLNEFTHVKEAIKELESSYVSHRG